MPASLVRQGRYSCKKGAASFSQKIVCKTVKEEKTPGRIFLGEDCEYDGVYDDEDENEYKHQDEYDAQ